MRRHPELSHRTPSKLCTNRGKAMGREVVAGYFRDLGALTDGVPPEQIWNMDESGFQFEHNPIKVVCKKGTKALGSRVSSSRENVTIIGCASGAGTVLPPMFIVKGKTFKSLNSFNTADAPPHSVWTWQAKAWMEDSLGVEWLTKIFLPHCGPQRPQVLILDQHHSHEVYEMIMMAKRENIHMVALPPHTSHWLQPLDKGCFSALSRYYRSICSDFMASSRQQVVNKASFTRLFSHAWEKGMTPTNARSGFRVTEIVPFNPEAIPDLEVSHRLRLNKIDLVNFDPGDQGLFRQPDLDDAIFLGLCDVRY
ncbi:tigger transposable element-derived protein 1 [Elysia marginata]|uniref:Tigger transposable element-derived protein 1 n=1 Tax=Elysia marginata TaxID=1093978 RepID=A0AAV4G9F4_9GAST|nr:tigger transposable element-derived protein 1 [Elysia marginata]